MQPHVNEVVNQKALLRKLRDEVALLRKQLVRSAWLADCSWITCMHQLLSHHSGISQYQGHSSMAVGLHACSN